MELTVSIRKQLGDFSLTVDFVACDNALGLLGQSGSGKSVTLQCIAGIMTPDSGRIVLDGQVLFDSEAGVNLPPQQRCVGYLFQHYALFPHWTVAENLAVIDRENTAQTLQNLDLEPVATLKPHQLSGGQKQRVALGRMLLSKPKVVLLDEPLSALDEHLSWSVERQLRETLQGLDCPVIWVSHNPGEVRRNCNAICVLDAGASQPVTSTQAIFTAPTTLAAARLAGFENVLTSDQSPWQTAGAGVAIRGQDLHCGVESATTVLCQVVEQYEDLDGVWTLLQPLCGDNGLFLRMKGAVSDQQVWIGASQIHHLQ